MPGKGHAAVRPVPGSSKRSRSAEEGTAVMPGLLVGTCAGSVAGRPRARPGVTATIPELVNISRRSKPLIFPELSAAWLLCRGLNHSRSAERLRGSGCTQTSTGVYCVGSQGGLAQSFLDLGNGTACSGALSRSSHWRVIPMSDDPDFEGRPSFATRAQRRGSEDRAIGRCR